MICEVCDREAEQWGSMRHCVRGQGCEMMTALVFSSILDNSGEHLTNDKSTITKSLTGLPS